MDKVYVYLSPDIEYFHSRHLPYVITAILCTLVIVIGIPLILLLEPFINHKIDFNRVKPFLDQFQGCYKDKYRSFASYYMICRLIFILILIVNSSNNDFTHFLLLNSSISLALLLIILRPYECKIQNIFDGFILLVVVLTALIPTGRQH